MHESINHPPAGIAMTPAGQRRPWFMSKGYACDQLRIPIRIFDEIAKAHHIEPDFRIDAVDYFEAAKVLLIDELFKAKPADRIP